MGADEPGEYWSRRLSRDFSLRGTGHISYSEAYNEWMYRAKHRALRKALTQAAPCPDALDIGVGTGWCTNVLTGIGARVHGCDIVAESVARAQKLFPEAKFFQLDVSKDSLPSDASNYDLVTALDVLYHITDDAGWEHALAEIKRVLRPGGIVITTDGFGQAGLRPAAHVHFRSREQWNTAAARLGLEVIEVKPLYRWLSRDPGRWARTVPDGLRGALEFALETLAPRTPHLRCAVLAPV